MLIGNRIRELRKQRKLKLYELAQKCGVQIATLSRMEHNKMTGTLDSHVQIASALGVELVDLYTVINQNTDQNEPNTESETDVFIHNNDASFEILTKNVNRKRMMPMLLTLKAGGTASEETNPFSTEKFIYALEGSMEAIINGKIFILEVNHGLYFDAGKPHSYRNPGSQTCKALIIATPVQL